jgi:hypothetical protein
MNTTTGVRALFSCAPGIGHFYPLLPLARELPRDEFCCYAAGILMSRTAPRRPAPEPP